MLLNRLVRKLPLSPRSRLEWYPPFRALGVRVLELADDWRIVRLRLPLNADTRNPGGTMFGGAQALVADPIAGLACARRFPGHMVWTRNLRVDFLKPGTTDLELVFRFDERQSHAIAEDLRQHGRSTPAFEYALHLADGTQCTRVHATIAIRPSDK